MLKRIISIILIALILVSFFPSQALAKQSTVVKFSVKKNGNISLSKDFKVRHFACECGCDTVYIDLELVSILQNISDHFGKSIKINSGYRCPSRNKKIGGASNSQHMYGRAADIVVSGIKPDTVAKYAETIGVWGIGEYSSFVHVDTRAKSSKYYWEYYNSKEHKVSTHNAKKPNSQPYTFNVKDYDFLNLDTFLNINMMSYPKKLTKGKSFSLSGVVSSNKTLSSVKGEIIDAGGKVVQSVTEKPGKKTLTIGSSDINSALKFGKLSDGTYTLKITATDSVKSVEWKKSFTVGNASHTHKFTDAGYSSVHPHYKISKCTCGEEKTGTESKFTTTDVKVSEASCSETGLIEKRCDICGYVISKTEIPKTAHTIVIVSGKDATCTESGIGHGEYCSVCNEILATGAVLPAKGHSGKLVGFIEATKDSEGYTGDVVCENCGEVLEKGQVIPAVKTETSPFVGDMMLTLKDKNNKTYYYHIPQLIYSDDRAKEVNREIYNDMIIYYDMDELQSDYNSIVHENMSYGVSQKNDVVSVVFKTNEICHNHFVYMAYNISSSTGKVVDNSYVISLFGFREDKNYYDLLRTKMKETFIKDNGTREDYYANTGDIGDDYYDRQLEWTLSDENVKAAVPFVDKNGGLSVVAYIGATSGADCNTHIVNITGEKDSDIEFVYGEIADIPINEYIPEETPDKPDDMEKYLLGDVNKDGDVTAADATQILRYINGKTSAVDRMTTEEMNAICDVNSSSDVSAADATQILRHINGKTSVFDKMQ